MPKPSSVSPTSSQGGLMIWCLWPMGSTICSLSRDWSDQQTAMETGHMDSGQSVILTSSMGSTKTILKLFQNPEEHGISPGLGFDIHDQAIVGIACDTF